MHLPPVLWAWIRAPATHFLGARILTTLPLSIPPAAFSALPQHLPSPFSVIILSSQYLFQRGPIWISRLCVTSAIYYPQIDNIRLTTPEYRPSCLNYSILINKSALPRTRRLLLLENGRFQYTVSKSSGTPRLFTFPTVLSSKV